MAGKLECRPYDPKDPLRKNIYKKWDIIPGTEGRWIALDMKGHRHFYARSLELLQEVLDAEPYDDPKELMDEDLEDN